MGGRGWARGQGGAAEAGRSHAALREGVEAGAQAGGEERKKARRGGGACLSCSSCCDTRDAGSQPSESASRAIGASSSSVVTWVMRARFFTSPHDSPAEEVWSGWVGGES